MRELASANGEVSPLTADYVRIFMASRGCGLLLAEQDGAVIGLLSYSLHPSLYHAGPSGYIEELVVDARHRGRGVGTGLIKAGLAFFKEMHCTEASISTMPGNAGAQRLYRSLGFVDEAVLLETHFAVRDE